MEWIGGAAGSGLDGNSGRIGEVADSHWERSSLWNRNSKLVLPATGFLFNGHPARGRRARLAEGGLGWFVEARSVIRQGRLIRGTLICFFGASSNQHRRMSHLAQRDIEAKIHWSRLANPQQDVKSNPPPTQR